MMFAVYGLQPIGANGALEADGEVHWYCSPEHAAQDLTELRREMGTEATAYSEPAESNDFAEGTACEWHGCSNK
jgi:hypothetical protein